MKKILFNKEDLEFFKASSWLEYMESNDSAIGAICETIISLIIIAISMVLMPIVGVFYLIKYGVLYALMLLALCVLITFSLLKYLFLRFVRWGAKQLKK